MKKFLSIAFVVILLSLGAWFLFVSKSSSYSLLKFVPENSRLVIGFDLIKLNNKLQIDELKALPLFKSETGESNQLLIRFMEKPLESGIDLQENPIAYHESEGEESIHLLFQIANQEKFETFLKENNFNQISSELPSIQLMNLNEFVTLSWNSTLGVITLSNKNISSELLNKVFEEKEAPMAKSRSWRESFVDDKEVFCYFNLDNKKEGLSNFLPLLPKGHVGIGLGINFEKGKIDIENKNAFEEKEDAELFELLNLKDARHYLSQTIADSPILALQVKLNMKNLAQYILRNEERKETLNSVAESFNTKPEDLLDLLSGELAFSYSGSVERMQTRTFFGNTTTSEVDFPQAGIFIGVSNKEKLNDLLKQSGQQPNDGLYTFAIPFVGDLYLVVLEEGMVFFLDEPMAKTLASNKKFEVKSKESLDALVQKYTNCIYLDVQKALKSESFINSLPGNIADQDSLYFYTSLNNFSHVTAQANHQGINLEFNLLNPEQNSLTTFLKLLSTTFPSSKENQES